MSVTFSNSLLPTNAERRKAIPLATGVLDYFPAALVEIAKVSRAGNDQHNPGQPVHWSRGKSVDQADTMQRHFIERGTFDTDGLRHSAKMAWRALALLQEELELAGAPMPRGAWVDEPRTPPKGALTSGDPSLTLLEQEEVLRAIGRGGKTNLS